MIQCYQWHRLTASCKHSRGEREDSPELSQPRPGWWLSKRLEVFPTILPLQTRQLQLTSSHVV